MPVGRQAIQESFDNDQIRQRAEEGHQNPTFVPVNHL